MIALYRTDRGRFALDEDGSWQPSIKTTLVIPKTDGLSVAYCCGLLNSELLDLWYGVRGKTPRDVWRNYEPKPMAEIPYRDVDLTREVDEPHLTELAKLTEALSGSGMRGKPSTSAMRSALGCEPGARVSRRTTTSPSRQPKRSSSSSRAIADNRQSLLTFRDRFPELDRVVKDPWSVGPVEADEAAALAAAPTNEVVSIRTDPELDVKIETDGPLGKPRLGGDGLEMVYKKNVVAAIKGPEAKLALVDRLLGSGKRVLPKDLEAILVPKDLKRFEAAMAADHATTDGLLADGRLLVEAAERLTCRLYGVAPELEDEVVLHASKRASNPEEE